MRAGGNGVEPQGSANRAKVSGGADQATLTPALLGLAGLLLDIARSGPSCADGAQMPEGDGSYGGGVGREQVQRAEGEV